MVRPEISSLERLRNKVWIRALLSNARTRLAKTESAECQELTWTDLVRQLLEQSADAKRLLPIGYRLQGVPAIVEDGADPHQFKLRVPADEVPVELEPKDKLVMRRRPGRAEPNSFQEKLAYVELHIDLVDCGETLVPGSSAWCEGSLWNLATPFLPHLDELRFNMHILKGRLGLISPTPEELRAYLSVDEMHRLEQATSAEKRERYRKSLEALTCSLDGYALSFLAGLVADSFMVGNSELSDLHIDAFTKATARFFETPELADVTQEFQELVVDKIVGQAWEFPASYHEPLMDAPLVALTDWQKTRGRLVRP